jgi:ABC-type branched-subunit amino acid transport system ATPase component
MHQGQIMAQGDEAEIRNNKQVTDIYLGLE